MADRPQPQPEHASSTSLPEGTSPVVRPTQDARDLAENMSALLAELARTPEAAPAAEPEELVRTRGPAAGDRLGRFLLRRELGRGGMGVVWEAEDAELARVVAVKVLRPGRRLGARQHAWLRREAEAVARLNHKNIVTLHDLGMAESGPFLVFELLRGGTLERRLREGPLPYRAALGYAVEVARALAHAHAAGVVHRDLKPGNVFLGEASDLKVLDFGLAALLGREGPDQGGTPAFMAPEQWRGELGDERADLFALGATLHAALTGRAPYPVKDGRSAVEQPGETPRLPPETAPRAFRRLVERCLERDPARRPASAAEVLAELRDLRQAWDGRRRRRLLGGVAGLALAAIALAGWQWWAREASPGERLATIVADVENGSGAAGLDGMTALLTAALAPSGRLDLLPRERLRRSARQAGLAEMTRLDGAAARTLARLEGAQVLLLPAARRDASGLRLEVRGLDPASGRTLLAVSEEAPSPAEVAPALDRLAEAVRRALHERAADLASGRSRVATALSADLGATQAYFEGLDCQARSWSTPNIGPQSCSRHFERALSIDPSFVAAHLQLAALGVHWRSLDEAKSHVRAVLGAVDRLPPVQALLLRALSAQLEERFAEAAAGYDAVLARAPEDVPALVLAAELRQFQGDYAGQLPYLERRLALDPLAEDPLLSLVWGYLRLGRIQELRALAERQAALPPTAQRVQALAWALQWLGRPAEAVAAAARARAASPGPAMTLVEAKARYATGDAAGAEPLCRVVVAAEPEDPSSWWCVARSLGMQGRFSEALAKIDEARNLSEREGHAAHAGVRAELSAGLGRPEALWADASRAAALDPNNADLALLLALGGDLAHAAEIARRADPSTLVPEEFEALQAWRQGDRAGALARLARAEQRDPIAMEGGIEPSYLIAVVAGADLPRETLAAVDRTRRLYCSAAYRSWTLPHCHLLAARAHLALGDRAAARAEVDALLKGWARADADLPLLREARALAATLR